jgi:hypothetical protein
MSLDDTLDSRIKELIETFAPQQRYFRPKEAAEYLRISDRRLEAWRGDGMGPTYSKPYKAIIYDKKDLDEFLAANKRRAVA